MLAIITQSLLQVEYKYTKWIQNDDSQHKEHFLY